MRGLALAVLGCIAWAHAAHAVCTLDPRDPFEPHAAMPRGPFAGRCLDTSEQRSVRTLTREEAAAFGLTVASPRVVIANVRHAGRYWLAEIAPDAVVDVILMTEYFPAAVPAAHTQLRFHFRFGDGVRLTPQVGRVDSVLAPLDDLVYSVEAVSPVGGERFDLWKGMQGHFATAYRFVSLDDRYRKMVVEDHHRVEQTRLALDPGQRRRVLLAAIEQSREAGLGRMYHTLSLNCTTELVHAVDGAVHYDTRHRVLAWLTGPLAGIPTECRALFAARGLLPKGERMPDLERERGPEPKAAASGR
jgi:hypothetical protein